MINNNTINEDEVDKTNIDKTVLDFLDRDFRIEPSFKSKALQFSDFVKFCEEFPHVLQVEEYARSILSFKNGVSIRTMIRLLSQFSSTDFATQRKVIGLLITNDKYVHPQVIFKLNPESKSGDKYELDIDLTLLYLKSDLKADDIKSNATSSDCYA